MFSSSVLARALGSGFFFIFVGIVLLAVMSATASAVVIDRSFGNRGWQQLPARQVESVFKPAGVLAVDGGFRAFGQMNRDLAIFAYTGDGHLDTDFHERGWRFLELARGNGNDTDLPADVVAHGAGHSVVAGSITLSTFFGYYKALTISRVADDGRLDRKFGNGGTTLVTRLKAPVAVAADRNERLFTISQTDSRGGGRLGRPLTPAAAQIAAFSRNGRLDRGFGKKGIARWSPGAGTTAVGVSADRKGRVLVLTRDRIGESRDDSVVRTSLVRFTKSGRVDRSFGRRGIATRPVNGFSAVGVQTLSDERVLVAGRIRGEGWSFVRYLPDGTMDPSFGVDGMKTTTGSDVGDRPRLRVTGSDDIVIAGDTGVSQFDDEGNFVLSERVPSPGGRNNRRSAFGISRADSVISVRGSKEQPVLEEFIPDQGNHPGFAENGEPRQKLTFLKPSSLSGLVKTPAGNLVQGAVIESDQTSRIELFRFKTGGDRDRTFGQNGSVALKPGQIDHVEDLLPLKRNAVTVVGPGRRREMNAVAVSPGGGQRASILPGIDSRQNFDAVPTSDGGLLVVQGDDFKLSRINADGTLRRSFGKNGRLSARLGRYYLFADSISVDRRGRILVGGSASCPKNCGKKPDYDSQVAFARFMPDGTRDRSFGDRGFVKHRSRSRGSAVRTVTLRDGRIIAEIDDQCLRNCDNDLKLMALTADGQLDGNFSGNGVLSKRVGRYFQLNRLFPSGKHGVDLASDIEPCGEESAVGVIRLNRSGRFDRGFGGGDGNIRAVPAGAVAAYVNETVKQSRDSVTMSAYLEPHGRYGGIEDTSGITRLKLNARDGKTSLKPCRR